MKKLLVVLLVLGLATPAMAASQWYWYGTSRMFLGYVDESKEFSPSTTSPYSGGIPSLDQTIRSTGSETGLSDSGVVLNMTDTTKIGSKIVVSDEVSAGVELSVFEPPTAVTLTPPISGTTQNLTSDYLFVRVLYGQWKFGEGSLRVGQDYTPATFLLYSNEIGDLGWGSDEIMTVHSIPYISRRPQIKLTFGGFQFALIEHNKTVTYDAIRQLTNLNNPIDDEDFNIPRMEAAFQWNINPTISLRPILGFQTYDAVQRTTVGGIDTETSKAVTSWLYGLGVNLRFGPAYVNLAGAGAVNPGNYGLYQPNQSVTRFASMNATGDIKDASSLSGMIAAGFVINPTIKVEAGFGYLKTESGESVAYTFPTQLYLKGEQASMNYYIQAPITLAPGVIITPEIGYLDMGDLEVKSVSFKEKQGNSMWVAAQFRIDF